MGGGSSSQASTQIANKSVVNAMTSSIMNCSGGTNARQTVLVQGNFNDVSKIKQGMAIKFSMSCGQDITSLTSIRQSVADAIKQASAAQSESVLGAITNSDSSTNLKIDTEVAQNITAETITNIVVQANNAQEVIIQGSNNIVHDIDQSISMSILADACNKVLSKMESVQAISNESEQKAEATQTNPISAILDSVFGGLQGLGAVWSMIIIAAMCVGAYVLIMGNPFAGMFSSSHGGPPGQQQQWQNRQQPWQQNMQQRGQQNMQPWQQNMQQQGQQLQQNMQTIQQRPPPFAPQNITGPQGMPGQQNTPQFYPSAPPRYSSPGQQLAQEVGTFIRG